MFTVEAQRADVLRVEPAAVADLKQPREAWAF